MSLADEERLFRQYQDSQRYTTDHLSFEAWKEAQKQIVTSENAWKQLDTPETDNAAGS